MHWLNYIIPRLVYKTQSSYNHDICVYEEAGKYKLLVNGSRESGEFIKRMWSDALLALHMRKQDSIKRILVLGVAGGTVIHLLHDMYPNAVIVGVDIDDVMIGIGKKYFGLEEMKSLICITDDAKHYVQEYIGKNFDCIVVDVFIGSDVPSFVQQKAFHKHIHHMLHSHGSVLINYAFKTGAEDVSADIHLLLASIYSNVFIHRTQYNRFFLACNCHPGLDPGSREEEKT